ncbi:SAM-dependent methyltransferase [Geodermatophilus sp. DF01-2]|uniref:O-methyltransferase n=1 Tax=Geodermatophilus sp. DF01-2 TaxID=2559610 RepID=UPI0010738AA0|nr:class I SAM-dependent methyltransferase [Geodermatophilus sp. DF01_2]TFV63993.1 SAM-dependent methyltransferase [Geodermatophilus sp. DF01_2]
MTGPPSIPTRVPPTPEVIDYAVGHSLPPDPVQRELVTLTREAYPQHARMQIAAEQGPLLTVLTRLTGGRRAVEVGTFTGYSSVSIARGLAPGGRLLCCDISEPATAFARRAWRDAGLADRIELRLGPAIGTLRAEPREEQYDFSFVDADKGSYPDYYEELLARTRPGGLLVFDNTLFGGEVLAPDARGDAARMRAFNATLAGDERVEVALLPIADGLTLVHKR